MIEKEKNILGVLQWCKKTIIDSPYVGWQNVASD